MLIKTKFSTSYVTEFFVRPSNIRADTTTFVHTLGKKILSKSPKVCDRKSEGRQPNDVNTNFRGEARLFG